MYNSPIELLVEEIQHQIVKQQDENIYQAVLNYIPNVDKEELIRALQYDRDQYEKGYADGKRDAMDELVRCKDCKHLKYGYQCYYPLGIRLNNDGEAYVLVDPDDDFCSCGERRTDNA